MFLQNSADVATGVEIIAGAVLEMFIRASGRFWHSLFRLFIHLPRSVQQSLPLLLGQHRQGGVVALDQ